MAATERDPVCGMAVDPERQPDLKIDYKGSTYWFCSRGCLLDFKDDPEAYLDPSYEPGGM